MEGFYTGLDDVFVLEDMGHDQNGNKVKERRNGNGARVYGVNLDGRLHMDVMRLYRWASRCSAANILSWRHGVRILR